jgi:hypothetical protein
MTAVDFGRNWARIGGLWPKWDPTDEEIREWSKALAGQNQLDLENAISRVRKAYASPIPALKWFIEALEQARKERDASIREQSGETFRVRRLRPAVRRAMELLEPMLRSAGASPEQIIGNVAKCIADDIDLDTLEECVTFAKERHPDDAPQQWVTVRRWLVTHPPAAPQRVEFTEVVSVDPAQRAEEANAQRTLARADEQRAHTLGIPWPPAHVPGAARAHVNGTCDAATCWQCAMEVAR